MQKYGILLFLFLLLLTPLKGQSYYFSMTQASYEDLISPIPISEGYWDGFSVFSIGFPLAFSYFGHTYDSLHIGAGSVSFTINRTAFGIDLSGQEIGVFTTFVDLRDRIAESGLSPVSYLISGSAGSRIFKLEWKNAGLEEDESEADFVNIQLWLYEVDGTIEMRYGPSAVNNPAVFFPNTSGPQVGIYGDNPAAGYYLVGDPINPTLTNFPPFPALSGVPVPNTVYRFTLMPVAVHTASQSGQLTVYPNPFQDELWIGIAGDRQVEKLEISDLSGRILYSQNIEMGSNNSMNIPSLPSGLYTLSLIGAEGVEVKQIVKK